MRFRTSLLLLSIVFQAATAGSVRATSTTVPDVFPTVDAAISGCGACDTILVKQSAALQSVNVSRAVNILAVPTSTSTVEASSLPKLSSVTWTGGGSSTRMVLRGFHVTGTVTYIGNTRVNVENCRIDGGATIQNGEYVALRQSIVTGNTNVSGIHTDVALNTIVAGTLNVSCEGLGNVIGNLVVGPASIGIHAGSEVTVTRNVVRNCVDGILFRSLDGVSATENLVEDCSGSGIAVRVLGGAGGFFTRNTIRDCGRGFEANGLINSVTDNTIERTVNEGMLITSSPYQLLARNRVTDAGGVGISGGWPFTARGNRVDDSGGDGIVLNDASTVDSNVVVDAGGRGLVMLDVNSDGGALRNNTVYRSGSHGLSVTGGSGGTTTIERNISSANLGAGLSWSGTGARTLGCNDWHANSGGTTVGTVAGASDVSLNPLFCNAPAGDVSLSSVSPVLDLLGCGRLGALGQGCSTPVAVQDGPSEGPSGMLVLPMPARAGVMCRWAPLDAPAELHIYDASGALRWRRAIGAGERQAEWSGHDTAGQPMPAGVYFARLQGERRTESARLVLVR